ncbi:hypothetical protein EUTSA_v10002209mg [Eutrema salsugineum]|uniref:RNase H type-1 domain-containing protein n=1 Tax=Eutrema salsugineum TaxID=72664 RepID=V4M1R1_EUTSA|nr:hypothetical protein EUTSA_v10002209mg [Eutrema salsugineum]
MAIYRTGKKLCDGFATDICEGFAMLRAEFATWNTDAAWCKEKQTAGLGWFLGNILSREFQSSTTVLNVGSALMAEALSIRKALETAKEENIDRLIILLDSQVLIKAINSKHLSSEIHGTLSDIFTDMKLFKSILFRYIPELQIC